MIAVIATLRAKSGMGDQLAEALEQAAPLVRSGEPGCSYYQPCRSLEDRDVIKVFEVYDSQEAIAAHRETPHFRALKEVLGSVLAEAPSVEQLDVLA